MAATVQVNELTVVHRKSDGQSSAFPDVCKSPSAPVPYTNVAFSRDAAETATTVFADGEQIMIRHSIFSTSTGDEPGVGGGVISGTYMGKASFVNYSFDVKAEGENVPRLSDPMAQNHGSPPNVWGPSEQQPNIDAAIRDMLCVAICACRAVSGFPGVRTMCVDLVMANPRIANGNKLYWDPRVPGVYPEVPFLGNQPLLSQSQKSSLNPSLPLPDWHLQLPGAPSSPSDLRGWPQAGTVRPDFVIARDPTQPLSRANIGRIVEIKFNGDSEMPGQYDKYAALDPTGQQPLVINEKDCNCGDDPPPLPVPVLQPDEEVDKLLQRIRDKLKQLNDAIKPPVPVPQPVFQWPHFELPYIPPPTPAQTAALGLGAILLIGAMILLSPVGI